jgi:RecA-family ATPase
MRKDIIENNSENSLPILDIKNVLMSKPEKLDFVLDGLLAGTVGALISPGGVGKSAYVLAKMKQVSKQGRAVYLSLEDNIDMLKHRLHSLYNSSSEEEKGLILNPEKFLVSPLEDRVVKIEDDEWFSSIKEIATNSRILFIDTLRKFHRSNENDSGEMSFIIDRLSHIASTTGCAIVFVHHTSKSGLGGSQQASRGSSVLTDNIRHQAYLEPMSEAEAKTFGIKDATDYFKAGVSKVNAGRKPSPVWFKKVSDPDPEIDGFYVTEVCFNKEVEANNNKDGEYRL